MEHWNIGTSEHWNIGIFEHWNIGKFEHLNIGTFDYIEHNVTIRAPVGANKQFLLVNVVKGNKTLAIYPIHLKPRGPTLRK